MIYSYKKKITCVCDLELKFDAYLDQLVFLVFVCRFPALCFFKIFRMPGSAFAAFFRLLSAASSHTCASAAVFSFLKGLSPRRGHHTEMREQ